MKVTLLPAFQDNYIFAVQHGGAALVVDPGSASEVIQYLNQNKIRLKTILITHHHADHIGGVVDLQKSTGAEVFGPKGLEKKGIGCTRALSDGDMLNFGPWTFRVLEVPGHTLDHLAFFCEAENVLFCGDTIFSFGCGRLFEGTAAQMYVSLEKLKNLPAATQIYCTHEYTLRNLNFSLHYLSSTGATRETLAEYEDLRIKILERRNRGEFTIPVILKDELKYNLFLKSKNVSEFAAIREARNSGGF